MLRTRKCAARPVPTAVLIAMWLAAATAQAAAIGGAPLPSGEAQGPMLPAQMQQAPNVETSIAILHQRLGISPVQEPAFAALANVMRENARMAPAGPPPATADAVYQLRLAIRYAQQEVDGMRRMLPALQSLYAVLTPQQRAIANEVFRQGPSQ
jgi:periplasmic protein CpxP/Spy